MLTPAPLKAGNYLLVAVMIMYFTSNTPLHTSLPSDADTSVLTEVTYPLVSDEELVSDKELLSDFEEEYSWEDIRGRDAQFAV